MTTTISQTSKPTPADPQHVAALSTVFYRAIHCFEITIDGIDLIIGYARGYSAGGCIGTEMHGVFVANKTAHDIISDQLRRVSNPSCWMEGDEDEAKKCVEDVLAMSRDELVEALSQCSRTRYNPFSAADSATSADEKNQTLWRRFKPSHFVEHKRRKPGAQSRLVREWEGFLVARLYGNYDLWEQRFSPALYKLFINEYGYIAHYNRVGFLEAAINPDDEFREMMELAANQKTLYGQQVMDAGRLHQAIATITKAYRG
jgi:hypothetical protein